MIKYNYLIERPFGKYFQKFIPISTLNCLPDCVYIKGPNAIGKSTLLNIIALSFFGHRMKDSEIPTQLKDRLNDLLDTKQQLLNFEIDIENSITGDKLRIEKNNPETSEIQIYRIVGSEKKPISYELLCNDFRLIYDIPINPLERLHGLLNEIKSSQGEAGQKVTNFRIFLQDLIKDIQDSKDPDQIKELSERIGKHVFDNERITEELKEREANLKTLRQYYCSRSWVEINDSVNEKQIEKSRLQQKIKNKTNETKKLIKNKSASLVDLRSKVNNIRLLKSQIRVGLDQFVPEKDEKILQTWINGDIEKEIYYPDIYNVIRLTSKFLYEWLDEKYKKEQIECVDIIEKDALYNVLIQALDDFRYKETPIPVLNQPVRNFIAIIQKEKSKYSDRLTSLRNYQSYSEKLKDLTKQIELAIPLANRLKESKEETIKNDVSYEEIQDRIEELDILISHQCKELESLEKEILVPTKNEITENLRILKKEPYLETFLNYTKNQLIEKIDSEIKAIELVREKKRNVERTIDITKSELERLEKKEPHSLFNSLSLLETIKLKTVLLEKKITSNFYDYINKAISANDSIDDENSEEVLYFNQLAKFLGKKMGEIRYIDKLYDIDYVDVFKETIGTKDGEIINFGFISSGQSQAAYLNTLLSLHSNKKIIALFDEVATMDEKSLRPIKEKIKDLYHSGQLLLAIIVQKDETISYESLL